jgi:ferredoxin-like protein FixX
MGTVNENRYKTDGSAPHINISQLSTQNKFQNEQLDPGIMISG